MNKHSLEQFNQLHNEITELISNIWPKFVECNFHCQSGNVPGRDAQIDSWEPADNGVSIAWSESWNYGGYDSGYTWIDEKYLFDSNLLDALKVQRQKEADDKKVETEIEVETKEKELLQALTDKYLA